MQALRAGWPEQFGGLYAEEEMERARTLDLAASEIVNRQREENRMIAIAAKDTITVSWGDWALENVPLGQFADRVLGWMEAPERTPQEVAHWAEANREPLRLFWAKAPADALALKKAIEARSRGAKAGFGGGGSGNREPGDTGSASAEAGANGQPRADDADKTEAYDMGRGLPANGGRRPSIANKGPRSDRHDTARDDQRGSS